MKLFSAERLSVLTMLEALLPVELELGATARENPAVVDSMSRLPPPVKLSVVPPLTAGETFSPTVKAPLIVRVEPLAIETVSALVELVMSVYEPNVALVPKAMDTLPLVPPLSTRLDVATPAMARLLPKLSVT